MNFTLEDRKYIGKLCKRGHDHTGTGGSYRYKFSNSCIECNAVYQKAVRDNPIGKEERLIKSREKQRKFNEKNPEYNAIWLSLNRKRAKKMDKEYEDMFWGGRKRVVPKGAIKMEKCKACGKEQVLGLFEKEPRNRSKVRPICLRCRLKGKGKVEDAETIM